MTRFSLVPLTCVKERPEGVGEPTPLTLSRFWSVGSMTSSERLPEVNTVGKLLFLLSSVRTFYHSNVEADGLRGMVLIKPGGWALAWDYLGLNLSMLVPFLISVTREP